MALITSIEELDAVRLRCKSMVKKRALASSGMVLVPLPGVDIAADVIGQLVTKQVVLLLLQKVGLRLSAKQALKFIPFAGQAAAAALSGSAMLLIGHAHIDECYAIAKKALAYQALPHSDE